MSTELRGAPNIIRSLDETHNASVVSPSPLGTAPADTARCSLKFSEFLTYEQAAQYLSVSISYLRKLKARGKIPYVPMGRGVRFRVKSLNEWAERREIK